MAVFQRFRLLAITPPHTIVLVLELVLVLDFFDREKGTPWGPSNDQRSSTMSCLARDGQRVIVKKIAVFQHSGFSYHYHLHYRARARPRSRFSLNERKAPLGTGQRSKIDNEHEHDNEHDEF
jgi:hypothetical protein